MSSTQFKTNHVLLTGVPGIGKTTLVCKIYELLKQKNIPAIGFYTKEVRNQNRTRIGFDVFTLEGVIGKLARSRDILNANVDSRYKVGNYVVFVNEFESVALPELNKPINNAIVIIDEIGKMEMFSQPFINIVTKLFSVQNIKILATIPVQKGRPLPLVESLRNNPSNHVITVAKENRNNLTQDILYMLNIK